jgi:hypothetical protein
MEESFGLAIQEHLELQRRNRPLEKEMPLDGYREPGARRAAAQHASSVVLEDTQEWVMPDAPTVIDHEPLFPAPEDLWSGTPTFDWGD